MSARQPLVLVIRGEPSPVDLYTAWLRNDYSVRAAYGDREALDKFDDEVGIVFLDRRVPNLSGDETLSKIRDRGSECRATMVTTVEPGFDIIAMSFGDYLVKPVSRGALTRTVSNPILRDTYDVGIQDLFSLASRKALLESKRGEAVLEENEEYQRLTTRLTELRRELDETPRQLNNIEGASTMYQDIGGEADTGNS